MKILALESASEACSAALSLDGEILFRYVVEPQAHARLLLPMIDEITQEAGIKPRDLDGIAYSHGPGSFTGVRIAAGMVQGIALGCEIQALGVSTLQSIAQRNYREHSAQNTLVVVDARMKEVYFGAYMINTDGDAILQGEECVAAPDSVFASGDTPWSGAGGGWGAYADALHVSLGEPALGCRPDLLPHAVDVLEIAVKRFKLGLGVPAQLAMPVYLRDKVAFTEKERAENKQKP